MKEIKIYNTLKVTIITESGADWTEEAKYYEAEINRALANENIDLAEYADYKKLHSIKIETEEYNNTLYGVAICKVDDDWNDEDTTQLKEYLTGQYSDGWGEGFEQREISEWTEEEDIEEYDEEEEDYYTDTIEVRCYAYVNFWQSRTFEIMTEDELKN